MTVVISVGVLAYNETMMIGPMLQSLLRQNLFQKAGVENADLELQIEIVVVPNGCTDDTAAIARSTLTDLIQLAVYPQVQWKVCEIAQAGKSNAWNTYVHQLSHPSAKYLFLMDADIELLDEDTMTSMIDVLDRRTDVVVAVDKPIKDVALKLNRTLIEQMSVLVSKVSGNSPEEEKSAWICGQLYCARAAALREIWLPTYLPAQDSFLYTMITTNRLQTESLPHRVILAKSASHKFEAYTQIKQLFRHQKWLILSDTINQLLFQDLASLKVQDVGLLIRQFNEEEPDWLGQKIQTAIVEKGWWLIPQSTLTQRFTSLQHQRLPKLLVLLPLTIAAFLVDLVLAIQANLELHQGKGLGYWGK
ncbi:MAG TPA: glycosyltransferase [Coleofasciculaceae cyanobacterium]|jgi:glycosyltransferase involved in cell wall biosynthesis